MENEWSEFLSLKLVDIKFVNAWMTNWTVNYFIVFVITKQNRN